ncbi:MAG: hypothetical protein GY752_06000 [bacterium]|nr:hypothetical protein [bacterium]MCP4800912.1 hypothetical protein [bacterium]
MDSSYRIFCDNSYRSSGNVMLYYWQDVVAVPLTLLIVCLVRRLRGMCEPMPISHIVGTVIAFAVVFEMILPLFSSRFTPDVWDLWCYILGGIIFYLFIRAKRLLKPKLIED